MQTGSEEAKKVVITAADSLVDRYNEKVCLDYRMLFNG